MLNVRHRTNFRLADELSPCGRTRPLASVLWRKRFAIGRIRLRRTFGESAIGGRVCKTNLCTYRDLAHQEFLQTHIALVINESRELGEGNYSVSIP
jgi:hypothetical protein